MPLVIFWDGCEVEKVVAEYDAESDTAEEGATMLWDVRKASVAGPAKPSIFT